jgi:oxygen-independent coproporphyrinogen-3 oxidase
VAEARLELAEESRYEEEYLEAAERLVSAGYEHYEVSNFARPGHRSRHNQVYWSGRPYLGMGNGAHSFLPPERRWNVRSWTAYQVRVVEGLPLEDRESVEGAARRLEDVWLGLRTDQGLPVDWEPGGPAARLVDRWAASGWVATRGGRLVATARGWLLLDRLAVELEAALEREDRRRHEPSGPGGG